METQFYTVDQAAKILKANKNTIRAYCREHKIPAIKVGRGYRIAKKDLENWLRKQAPGKIALKQEEQRLIETEDRYRNLFENASDAIVLFDVKGCLLLANPKFCELYGGTPNEVKGMHFARFIHTEDLPLVTERFLLRITNAGAPSRYEARAVRKDGQVLQVEINSSRFMEGGKPSGIQVVIRDITERRRAELALKRSEERYRGVVEDQSELICRWFPNRKLTFVNDTYSRFFGRKSSNLIGHDFLFLIPKEDQNIVKDNLAKLNLNNPVATYDHRVVAADGKIRWIRWTNRIIADDQGKMVEFQSVGRDVTDYKRAEQEVTNKTEDIDLINLLNNAVNRGKSLKEILSLLAKETKRIFSSHGATILFFDDERNHLVVQKYMLDRKLIKMVENMLGIKIPEIEIDVKKKSTYLNVLQEGRAKLLNEAKDIEELITEYTNDKTLQKLAPKIRKFLNIESVMIIPLISDHEAIGVLDVSRDAPFNESDVERFRAITEQITLIIKRKQAEDSLRESKEMYQTLVKASPDAVTVTDLDGNITFVSQKTLQLHGYKSAEELLGKSAFQLIAPEFHEAATKNLRKTLRKGYVENMYYVLIRADGSHFIAELNSALIRGSNNKPMALMATTRDVTDREKTEKERRGLLNAVEACGEGIAILDKDEKFTYVNKAFANIHAYQPKELIGKSWRSMVPMDHLEKVDKKASKALESEGKWIGLCEAIRKDGNKVWVNFSITVLKDKEGHIDGYINILRGYMP